MARYVKKDGIWQIEGPELETNLPLLTTRQTRIPASASIVTPIGLRPSEPGHYYTPDGPIYAPPRGVPARFLRIDIAGNDKQFRFFQETSPLRLLKQERIAGRKARMTRVVMELAGNLEVDYVLLPYDGSAIQLVSSGMLLRPLKTVVENYYERNKGGDKIINKFVLMNELPYHEANSILQRYDRIYAVDTNTSMHRCGRMLSVTSVFSGHLTPLGNGYFTYQSRFAWCSIGFDVQGSPEVAAWIQAISRLFPEPGQELATRTAIVVDSELDKIEPYNERKEPFAENLYLPDNFALIYATDAAGGDQYVTNKLISLCHAQSAIGMKALKKKSPGELEEGEKVGVIHLNGGADQRSV